MAIEHVGCPRGGLEKGLEMGREEGREEGLEKGVLLGRLLALQEILGGNVGDRGRDKAVAHQSAFRSNCDCTG